MRGWAAALGTIAVMLSAAVPAGAAVGSLTDVSDAGSFPYRTWVLSLPKADGVRPADVRLLENGEPVTDLHVSASGSLDAPGGPSASILVIDASNSMRGEPIDEAMAAARAFAARRNEEQALGVVAFNDSASVLLEPTTDDDAIDAALRQPPDLALHTHIGEGVEAALESLSRSGTDLGSLVVLSDGDDTGDPASLPRAVRRAETDNVRIFTVAMRSKDFTPTSLEGLAAATGGAATVADSPRDVRAVFAALGERLGAEYQVRYRSSAPARAPVRVEANVGDGPAEAIAEYRVPTAAAAVPSGTYSRDSFWGSSAGVVAVTLACVLLVGFAVVLLLHRPARAPLADRVAAYAGAERTATDAEDRGVAGMAKIVERTLSATGGRWERFVEEVDVARVRRSPSELALAAGGAFLLFLVVGAVAGAPFLALLGLLAPVAVVAAIRFRAGRERSRFGEQLADNLQVFASALRAGHSFTGALGPVVRDAPEPTHREFSRSLADERVGVPIDEALARIGRRMRSREMNQVAMIATLQQETGGNTAEVLDRVVDSVRERQDLRRMVRSLTAQGRISQAVVTVLPFAIATLVSIINPGYLSPLFASAIGWALVIAAVIMTLVGSLAIRKIVNIRI